MYNKLPAEITERPLKVFNNKFNSVLVKIPINWQDFLNVMNLQYDILMITVINIMCNYNSII